MATINFEHTFGNKNTATSAAKDSKAPAQVWLNIGYDSGVKDAEGNSRFVSLPMGIPLDPMEALPTNSRNVEYAAFNQARNDLLAQVLAAAEALEAGEERILNLQIQMRRVHAALEETAVESNPFTRKLDL